MAKIVPANAPVIDILSTKPGETVLADDYKNLFELQNFLYSQDGTRITGMAFDPLLDLNGVSSPMSLGWWALRPLRPQGAGTYYFTVQVTGFNYWLRARFYSSNGTSQDMTIISYPTTPRGFYSEEIVLVQLVDIYRLEIEVMEQDSVLTSDIEQITVVASPLDPSRDW